MRGKAVGKFAGSATKIICGTFRNLRALPSELSSRLGSPKSAPPGRGFRVSHKSAKISALIASFEGQVLDAHYLGYFECFNSGLFYEAHDVLEELWLPQRGKSDDGFYKGLIQFAGAFVHLQKDRLKPAAALFRLSRNYLSLYPPVYHSLDVARVIDLAGIWIVKLEAGNFEVNPLSSEAAPRLELAQGV